MPDPEPGSYTVGWICAIQTEYVAARCFLDERYELESIPTNDNNHYTLGRIHKHNVVIVILPSGEYGLSSATAVLKDLLRSFPNIRIGLMVGIGGGAPSQKHDIRLGDIVVSTPHDGNGGVFQYDFGKTIQGQEFKSTGYLSPPPVSLLTAISGLKTKYQEEGHRIGEAIDSILRKNRRLQKVYGRPEPSTDRLYRPEVVHESGDKVNSVTGANPYLNGGNGQKKDDNIWYLEFWTLVLFLLSFFSYPSSTVPQPKAANHPKDESGCLATCGDGPSKLVNRPQRTEEEDSPAIHYGLIASANQVMKNATLRDRLAAEKDVLCFEMEAAGLMNHFPCLVIRGICDYSDSHKSKEWQGYAAMTAAAYAKDILYQIAPSKVEAEAKLVDILSTVEGRVNEISSNIQGMKDNVEHLRSQQRLTDLNRWLSPPDPSTNYDKALQQYHEATGSWFLESDDFKEWKTRPSSFLWLHGIAGCGKTILSSAIIKNLSPCRPLYFFFDFNDGDKQTLESMIRALISQLCDRGQNISQLEHLYSSCGDGRQQPTCQSLRGTFLHMMEPIEETWLVLDALDECSEEERRKVLSWIEEILVNSEYRNVHLLMTSRQERDIESGVLKFTHDAYIVPIQSGPVTNDICAYVRWRVREGDGLRRWRSRPEVQNEIETALRENAHGMFRWAACQLDVLEKCFDYPQVRKALRTLPTTLDETYERIVRRIPEEHKQTAIRILQFLTYSERPLRIEEAIDMIAVDTEGESYFDPKDRMPDHSEILCYCSSLVVAVTKKVHSDDISTETTDLQLAHFSVKEYLISNRVKHDIAQYFREVEAKGSMAKICLAYLLHLDADAHIPGTAVTENLPFLRYCAEHWTKFAARAESENHALQKFIHMFFDAKRCLYINCYNLHNPYHPPGSRGGWTTETTISALDYASVGGLENMVKYLLDQSAEINAEAEIYDEALRAASYGGHDKIVELLLDKGAYISAGAGSDALRVAVSRGHYKTTVLLLNRGANITQNNKNGNVLQSAASIGHNDIIKLLLDKGADVNFHNGGFYDTALQAASYGGYNETVKFLLDNGADVHSQGGVYGNALQAASVKGHSKVIELLLDNGADINAQGGRCGTALQAASYGGRDKIVRLLLNKGADVNVEGGKYGNALKAALHKGNNKVIELLLDKGADINTQGGEDDSALQVASLRGLGDIVRLLLDTGADVNAQGGYYGNALQAASFNGHDNIIKLLLSRGANANAQGGYYCNALQAASYGGHSEVVKLLLDLDKGVDVNAHGGTFSTALQAASYAGHRKIVELLLNKGADVNAQGHAFGGALQAASDKGHGEIVELLLDKGANVNAHSLGGVYFNALQVASFEGHDRIVELLISKGADVDARGGTYGNALQAASYKGRNKIISLLLDKGVNIHAQGGVYHNALQAASCGGRHETVELLLDKGASINAQGDAPSSALQAASLIGHGKVVKLLLDKGANVNAYAQSGDYLDALQAACAASRAGYEKVVELLLSHDADANAQGGKYGNALQVASLRSYGLVVIKLLLNKGADVNAQGGKYGNALQAASSKGYIRVVELLLNKGANPNAQGGKYGNALQAASSKGHDDIVRLLLNKGASVDAQSGITQAS
ncbi:hypothetical protein TWF718_000421 [Orbilia javanica]|uniref:Uncharacterized protein n=1 Tax=Orbilia javanica TaxID=47235 RepID=A0AAN8MTV8_9PEZI